MSDTTITHYSPRTGEGIRESAAGLSSLDGLPEILGFSTDKVKPETGAHECAVFRDEIGTVPYDHAHGDWVVVADYRGHVYWTAEREKVEITELGVVPPPGALSEDPGPTLAKVKADKIALLTKRCADEITAGFTSDALGAVHSYPSLLTDQFNLSTSVIDSMRAGLADGWTTPFWCADGGGNWAKRPHTVSQIQQAGSDCKNHVITQQAHKDALVALVESEETDTIAKVEAIKW